jgi:hypothetical protein
MPFEFLESRKDKELAVTSLIEENLQKRDSTLIIIRRLPVLQIDAQDIQNDETNRKKNYCRKKCAQTHTFPPLGYPQRQPKQIIALETEKLPHPSRFPRRRNERKPTTEF